MRILAPEPRLFLIEALAQFFTGFEKRNMLGIHMDGGSGSGIAPGSFRAASY